MKKTLIALAFVAVGGLFAQDMTPQTAVEAAGGVDGGQELVTQFENNKEIIAGETADYFVSSDEQADNILNSMGIDYGYSQEKNAIIQKGTAYLKVDDPANDKDFQAWRMAKANEAYLAAKGEVIRSISTEMSAFNRMAMSYSEGKDENANALIAKEAELDEKRRELAKKLAQLDEAEAEALSGITMSDCFGAILEGITKKLNDSFNAGQIKGEKKALYEELKIECDLLKAEFDTIKSEADNIPQPKNENESQVKLLSRMPLLGSSVVCQTESWDETSKTYSITMVIVWSPKMQEEAIAIYRGGVALEQGSGKYTPQEWIKQQDLSSMVGPRRIRDKNGHTIFMGIACADLSGQVSDIASKKRKADTDAWYQVAFSLAGDLEAYREAKNSFKEYDDDNRVAMQNFTENTMQKCTLKLGGCMKLRTKECIHPISRKKIYVTVYYLDPSLAKDADELFKKAYAGAEIQTKITQYRQGQHDAMEQALEEQRNSKVEYNRGTAEGRQAVKTEVQKQERQLEQRRTAQPKSAGAAGSQTEAGPRKSQGGTFSGDALIDTDF